MSDGNRVALLLTGLALGALLTMTVSHFREERSAGVTVSEAESDVPSLVRSSVVQERLAAIEARQTELAARLERLQLNLQAAMDALERRVLAVEQPLVAQTADTDAGERQDAESAALEERRRRERIDVLSVQHAEEAVDSAWSTATADTVFDLIQRFGRSELSLREIDCRTTRCRLLIEHENSEALNSLVQALPAAWSWDSTLEVFSEQQADGSTASTIHIRRDAASG